MRKIIAILIMCVFFAGCGKSTEANNLQNYTKQGIEIIEAYLSGENDPNETKTMIDDVREKIDTLTFDDTTKKSSASFISSQFFAASTELTGISLQYNEATTAFNTAKLENIVAELKERLN